MSTTPIYGGENGLEAGGTIRGGEGKVICKYDNKTFVLGNLKSIKATVESDNGDFKVLGSRWEKHKVGSLRGKFDATIVYDIHDFRNILDRYSKSGKSPVFTIQITNNDTTTDSRTTGITYDSWDGSAKKIGRQTVTLKGCLIDEFTLAKLDVDEDVLEEDISGTFDGYSFSTITLPYASELFGTT